MIIYKRKAYKKIEKYILHTYKHGEIGGLLVGKIFNNGDIEVEDAICLPQAKGQASFEINDEVMMDLTKNESTDFLFSIIGWWHSHADFSTFWSVTDDRTFRRLANMTGFCIGVVGALRNKKKREIEYRHRIDMLTKDKILISIDDLKVEYGEKKYHYNTGALIYKSVDDEDDDEAIAKEIREKLKHEDAVECDKCKGLGYIIEKSNSWIPKSAKGYLQNDYNDEETLTNKVRVEDDYLVLGEDDDE